MNFSLSTPYKIRSGLKGLLASLLFLSLLSCGADMRPRIELQDGAVVGQMAGNSRLFIKIPYAKPPVGELRWRAPVANDPWKPAVQSATEFSASCPQLADQGAPASDNEDCLYLNVWAPNSPIANAPVMVWIHGGGNFSGGAGIPIPVVSDRLWFDGQYFAENQGVVVVTLNYRLGPFGFFAHPELTSEGQPIGNQGLLDQRLALEWVQKNISSFGGDPNNVTIFGESAGAANVCYHMASLGSRGLFHRAISQSGSCTIRTSGREDTVAAASPQMVAFGSAVGCEEGVGQLECMRNVSVSELLANSNQPSPGAGDPNERKADWVFGVVFGGANTFLPESPRALFQRGDIANVPYLLGANTNEGTTVLWQGSSISSEQAYKDDLHARFGEFSEAVYAMYPPVDYGDNFNAAREAVVTDSRFLCGTHDVARLAADAGLDVFMYNFNVPWALLPSVFKVAHAAEISQVFGRPFKWTWPINKKTTNANSQKVADAMNTYWANFARTGNPNGENDPTWWPQFFTADDKRLQLDNNWDVLENYRSEQCEFWREYFKDVYKL